MTNYEKYKDEILKRGPTAFGMKDGQIAACKSMTCFDCYFSGDSTCNAAKLDWLFEDYIEKPVLTRQEHVMCLLLEDGYITRLKNKLGTNLYYSKLVLLNNKEFGDCLLEDGPFAVITSFCDLIGAGFDFIEPNSYYNVKDLRCCAWVDD